MTTNKLTIMTLNEYQKAAMSTCMPSCDNLPYMLFNLQGEVGELSSKVAKLIRKGELRFISCGDDDNEMWLSDKYGDINEQVELETALIGELGDILWQLSGVCSVLGFDLDAVAKSNLNKLASRKSRGVIDGNGDNR